MIDKAKLWSGRFLIQLLGRLPLLVADAIAKILARLMWLANGRARQITEVNLAICFPDTGSEDRQTLARKSLYELTAGVIDMARCWVLSRARLEGRIRVVAGREHLDDAVAAGQGTLVLVPHLGSWEMVSLYLTCHYKITALYREPRVSIFDDYVRDRRERHGARLMPINTAGLRAVLRALRANDMACLFPDQVPPRESGQFAPFFGEPTLTMTLGTKLLHKSGARAVSAFCKRLPGGDYELVFRPVDDRIYDADLATSLAGLNSTVEACVRECPEQYQWAYRRFKFLPNLERRHYWSD